MPEFLILTDSQTGEPVYIEPATIIQASFWQRAEDFRISPAIPLSERRPREEDCMVIKCQAYALHYCWLGRSMLHAGINRLTWDWRIIPFGTERGWEGFTHWLPADVRYLPAAEE